MTDASETKVPRLSEGARQKLERLEQMYIGEDSGIAASMALSLDLAVEKLERDLVGHAAEIDDLESMVRESRAEVERLRELLLRTLPFVIQSGRLSSASMEVEIRAALNPEPPAEDKPGIWQRFTDDVKAKHVKWSEDEPPAEENQDGRG